MMLQSNKSNNLQINISMLLNLRKNRFIEKWWDNSRNSKRTKWSDNIKKIKCKLIQSIIIWRNIVIIIKCQAKEIHIQLMPIIRTQIQDSIQTFKMKLLNLIIWMCIEKIDPEEIQNNLVEDLIQGQDQILEDQDPNPGLHLEIGKHMILTSRCQKEQASLDKTKIWNILLIKEKIYKIKNKICNKRKTINIIMFRESFTIQLYLMTSNKPFQKVNLQWQERLKKWSLKQRKFFSKDIVSILKLINITVQTTQAKVRGRKNCMSQGQSNSLSETS